VATADNTLGLTARQAGLARCNYCGALHRLPAQSLCRRCGAQVSSRKHSSLQRTWAYLIVGLMAYIPANIYPIMITKSFSGNSSDTIFTDQICDYCRFGTEPAFSVGNVGTHSPCIAYGY